MKTLLKKPIVIIWIIILLFSIGLLLTKGIQYGVDFSGGTSFSIVLEKPVESDEMPRVVSIINRRLDWAGLKDAKVTGRACRIYSLLSTPFLPHSISIGQP